MRPSTIDADEVAKFERMAREWWDPNGPMRPLHRFNPVRLGYIKRVLCRHFDRDPQAPRPLDGLRIVDIGCGAGILSEPLARLGATVTGIDASETNIEVARRHAERAGVTLDYRCATAEDLADASETFEVVLAMEIVEHVPDLTTFVAASADLVGPGGLILVATINRTPKAWLLAIVGAERVLRWLPPGSHAYEKFVKPTELSRALHAAGMSVMETTGVVYHPLADRWATSRDTDVNYMMLAGRGA